MQAFLTLLDKIHVLKGKTFVLGFLSLIFLVTPGASFIFLYDRALFLQLDLFKLLLLCIAFIAPFVLLNFILSVSTLEEDEELREDRQFFGLVLSITMSGLLVYMALATSLLFLGFDDYRKAVVVLVLAELSILIIESVRLVYKYLRRIYRDLMSKFKKLVS